MHKYMRAIGFSELRDRRVCQQLVTDVIVNADRRACTSIGKEGMLAEFCKDFAPGIGICACGEFDASDQFSYDYYYPYLIGTGVSTGEDVSVERHAGKESYAGICDELKVGATLIFYLQNMIPYVQAMRDGKLPIKGTTLTLAGLSVSGKVILPLYKTSRDRDRSRQAAVNRTMLLSAARSGDEDAIESLTMEEMDTYTALSKKIHDSDVLSLVDTYFMPYGVECDLYSVMGEIATVESLVNEITEEEIWKMRIRCNDIDFDICINKKDLYGEPATGRRFRGTIWLQGHINFPENE